MYSTYSNRGQVLITTKYYLSVLVFCGSGALLLHRLPNFSTLLLRLLVGGPVMMWAVFLATTAEVEVSDRGVRYRRFLRWRTIPFAEIRGIRNSWHPGFAEIVLNKPVRRWAKLHFISPDPNSPLAGEVPTYVDEPYSKGHRREAHKLQRTKMTDGKSVRFYFIIGLAGALYGVLFRIFLPEFMNPDLQGLPAPVVIPTRLLLRASNWPWSLVTCGVTIALFWLVRFKKNSWTLVMVFGSLIGILLVEALSHIG
jgi:hypothetical protein